MTTGRPAFRAVVLLLGALVLAGCAASPTVRAAAAPGKTVRVTGVSGPVTILLDRHGIPHISAGSEADAAFAMGYMHARDRRFQMELLRMDALGRLRELLGSRVPPAVLRLELFSRALGFAREARDVLDNFPAEDQRILAAYADGVNAATAYEPEPLELHLLGYEPQPWTAADSLAILQTISFGFCKDWEQELVRLEIVVHQLRQGSTIDHALGIWPPRFDFPPHLIGVKPAKDPFAAIAPMAPELASSLLENLSASLAPVSPLVPPAATDPLSRALDLRFLSNNWAVSGTWTGTGKSAFAIDPHMPSSLPPLPYIVAVQLDSASEGSYHIIGASFPGLPAVPFGTNGAVAWGPTSNWADVTDLYVEKPAPGRPGFYQTEDGDRPFGSREEVFLIRHGKYFTEEKRTIRSTRHGVLVNDFVDRLPRGFPLVALARAPTVGSSSLRSIRLLYRAATVKEARTALQGFTAMVGHWVLADAQGNIGYASPVNLPLRRNSLGTVPVPGWNGKYDWKEFVAAADLPGIENPPQGFIATANNQVVQPESTGYPINFEGDVPFRVQRIISRLGLGRSGSAIAAQMSILQTDGMDTSFPAVEPLIEEALTPLAEVPGGRGSAPLASAARVLLEWDGSTDPDSPAPTLYQSLLTSLLDLLLSEEMSPETLGFLRFYFNSDPLLFGMLADRSNPVWKDRSDRHGEEPADVVAHAFKLSVAALQKRYGNRVSAWTWRRAAPVTLAHPLGGIPGFRWLNRSGIAPRGTASSIWIHKYDRVDPARFPVLYGPGLRLVVDFNDLPGSLISIPGGESGRPGTRHYADILPLFEKGEGVSLDMDPDAVAADTEERLVLAPATGN